ncbi:MAG TPA: POTRA domain-containing protein [Methylophilaceae bacterium]|jgi:hemolysin activation/secretion protein
MRIKRTLVCLGAMALLVGSQQAMADANPEGALPAVEKAQPSRDPAVKLDTRQEVDERLRKLLATRIHVKRFDIIGAKTIPSAEIDAITKPYLDGVHTVQDYMNLASDITKLYRDRGYPLSFAYIPAQTFANHEVKIEVIEGFVGKLVMEGDFGNSEQRIREIVRPLLEERPLRAATLERVTGLLRLVQGLGLQAYLPLPKTRDGSAILTVKATRQAISAVGRFESLRPKTRAIVSVQTNSHGPAAEQARFTTLLSEDSEEYYAASYSQLLGSSGLRLNVEGSFYTGDSDDEDYPAGLARDVMSLRLSTSLSYPFIADRYQTLTGSVGINAINYEDRIRNTETLRSLTSKTNSRALVLAADYTLMHPDKSLGLQLALSKGIDSIGASKSVRTNFPVTGLGENPADLDFEKVNIGATLRNAWPWRLGTAVSMVGQYSPDYVPVVERVQFGGYQFGRAFRPGFIYGDSGWGASAEVNRLIPASLDLSYFQLVGVQPYLLAEMARTYQKVRVTDIDRIKSLALGVRLKTDVLGVLDMAIAKALDNRRDSNKDDLTFSFNFGFMLN